MHLLGQVTSYFFLYGAGIVKSPPTPPSQLTLQETQIQRNALQKFHKKKRK